MRAFSRIAVVIVAAALLVGLYNDFAIRWRVEHSLAGALPKRTGLRLDGCRRITSRALQSKNYFDCTVRAARRGSVVYRLGIDGRCWSAAPGAPEAASRPLRGCLSPFAPGSIGGS